MYKIERINYEHNTERGTYTFEYNVEDRYNDAYIAITYLPYNDVEDGALYCDIEVLISADCMHYKKIGRFIEAAFEFEERETHEGIKLLISDKED